MDCASCVAKVTRALERMPGVTDVEVNLISERLSASLAPGSSDPSAVKAQVEALGYKVTLLKGDKGLEKAGCSLEETGHHHVGHDHDHSRGAHVHGVLEAHNHDLPSDKGKAWFATSKAKLVWALGVLVAAAWIAAQVFPAASYPLYLATTLVALMPFGRRAIALARAGSPFSIETLMVVAALGAAFIGAAEEAALVVLLFAIGEMLEGVAAGRARAGIQALVDLMPKNALRLQSNGTIETVSADRLSLGDHVLVRPGDRVPCDGTIIEGVSSLDESPVTGESVPVVRSIGEHIVAGSINTDGVLRVAVSAAGADSTLARIARLVEQATASRGRTQRFIERFSNVWTPGAMAIAALAIVVPPLFFGGEWSTWLYRGLALLLVACPCALVISVPAAMASGLSAGARRGLLVKGGAALEAIGGARTIAFDKTGTLTAGRPRVTDILPHRSHEEGEILRLASAVEAGSSHPLARAILEAAEVRGLSLPAAVEAVAVAGKSVSARVEGALIAVGSPIWASGTGIELPAALAQDVARLEAEGKTAVVVTKEREALGVIAMRDEPRPDAAVGIAALKRLSVDAVMLTGDNPRTGAAIADSLGLSVKASLLPADKLREIGILKEKGPVVMVGDGINDAPALAAASAGVAMGGGTDVALEAADAALMKERVAGIAELVELSRATLSNVKINVGIAVGLKLVFLMTTVTGTTGLWVAILADTGATVLVTLNALRLLAWKPA
ncbi:heavy metal translocating P-type ATPase [Teichococcus aestuarii]|uniref:P-type Zn(2+) transporter n=1 Tax=Teichococcus aestuarii TaxID=568898 RepID=A0A2U1UYW0_9PROT|nr:heavy metal translocating P-type ATPase [Pseudoroseomonas aestuarii]PWC26843.1 cadmium-translocating P-type ATPase [Pseudoroseomonas aestuarii]